jgi:hypothetical protein
MRLLLVLAAVLLSLHAWADDGDFVSDALHYTPQASDYTQLFTVQVGTFSPHALTVSNGEYTFNYGNDSLNSYMVEAGWNMRLFDLLGGWQLEEGLGFTSFTGSAQSIIQGTSGMETLRLNLISLDSRIMYSMEWFPWKMLTPFADGGYQYTFFSQSGNSDLESVQGGVGNPVAGLGLRFWVNRASTVHGNFAKRLSAIPVFITAKVNWVLPGDQNIDLSSRSYLAGVAVGL